MVAVNSTGGLCRGTLPRSRTMQANGVSSHSRIYPFARLPHPEPGQVRLHREGGSGRHPDALFPPPGTENPGRSPSVHHRLTTGNQAASSRIIAAPFSAIMIVGALVFPVVSVGITEASTTRKPPTARTRRRESTTLAGSSPMRQVPTG